MSDTLEIVRSALCERCGLPAAALTPDTSVTDLGLDSLQLLELVDLLEEKYSFSVPDADIPLLRSPGEIARYIDGRISGGGAAL